MRKLYVIFSALVLAYIMLSMNSSSSSSWWLNMEPRLSNYSAIHHESLVHRRSNREGPGGGNPSPAANPNDHQHHH